MDNDFTVENALGVLQTGEAETELAAINFLAQAGDSRAINPLLTVLMDSEEDGEVRQTAARALGKLGDLSTIAKLEWVQENDLEGVCWSASAKHEITAAITAIKSRLASS